MNINPALCIAAFTFQALFGTPAVLADAPLNVPPKGFVALFNGRNLDGWKGLVGKPHERAAMSPDELARAQSKADELMVAHWKIEDGVLFYDGKGKSLATAKDYADFEMYADWKILPKGDSGIYLRGLPQVQIWDPALRNVGSGGLYNNKNHPSQPPLIADNPPGEWNTFYIRMLGEQVTVTLNGQLVVDNVVLENVWEPGKPVYPSGQIELQHHGNTLEFRNIFIRELVRDSEVSQIQAALPKTPRSAPPDRRKLLVFTRATGYVHQSIPHGAHAFQLMGRTSGAYEAVITNDLTYFERSRLSAFDAVLLCNTTGSWIQPTDEDIRKLSLPGNPGKDAVEAELRRNLLDFVASGKGLVGIHSASDANYHWPEFGQLIGGYFNAHPWHERVGIRVEQPDHSLAKAFGGRDFPIVDEIYQFKDPYSRDRLQVLLSLDPQKTDMTKKKIRRTDGDFAVAWIRRHGKGRVFYSSLGHRPEIYWNPMIMQFYLDGIQFALGDLDVNVN